jgi:hypothetical protein
LEGKFVEIPLGLTMIDAMEVFITEVHKACGYNEEFSAYCLDITLDEFQSFLEEAADDGEEEADDL